MRWHGRRQSQNVEDRRRMGKPAKAGGIGGVGLIVVLGAMYFMGAEPQQLLNMLLQQQQRQPATSRSPAAPPSAQENQLAQMVGVVLADTEDVWNQLFTQMGKSYREPNLVLFSGAVQSACGFAQAAMGPFYCPGDDKVYIDLSFYEALRSQHHAPGDFAQAYVIAHEVGHHVQNLLGISGKVHQKKSRVSESDYNQLSVRLELQADFLAGVWAHHAHKAWDILESGDIDEALTAASAIGDDQLQRQARGHVVPDSFTHGSSAQRVRWFKKGLQSGDIAEGNTFEIPYGQL